MNEPSEGKGPQRLELKVILYGVGAIGSQIARLILKKKGLRIVGAVDVSPEKAGRDLGEVIGSDSPLGVKISDDPEGLLSSVEADVAVHATSSFLRDVYPQLVQLITHDVNVVSTCEELSYPYFADASLAREIDRLAKKHGVTVLGTGINPGFLMDTLPIALSGVCQEVRHIRVERVIDAAKRRLPFQKKIGAGLTVEEFEEKIKNHMITGHVGLEESIAMIADALGLELQRIEVKPVRPVIAEKPVESPHIKVDKGRVAGLSQSAYGVVGGRAFVTLIFKAYIGVDEEYDSITIKGTPSINQRIVPCVHGDLATAAVIVNSIPKVIRAPPGLKTMKDLPVPSAVMGDMRKLL
jgi:4-hydroxy-tetrahydrodipicolinate reductase